MKNQGNKLTLLQMPPDPLHVVLLGPVNDVMDKLETLYPCEMVEEFYKVNHLKKSGEGPGGKFNGPSIKHVLKEETLSNLEETLPNYEIALIVTGYLRSLRLVHDVSVAKDFVPILYNEVLENFKSQLEEMKKEIKISETLKIHVNKDHFKYYFDQTGQNFRETNAENLESPHSTLINKIRFPNVSHSSSPIKCHSPFSSQ